MVVNNLGDNAKEFIKILNEGYDWEKDDAKRIWCFGPDDIGANCVMDKTVGVQYLNEIKDSVKSAF